MPRVMLVDGYPNLRKLYVMHLKFFGLDVHNMDKYDDALVQLPTDSRFDAIFANVNFFDQAGLNFIEVVTKQYPVIPLVAILQVALAENTVEQLRRLGVNTCLIAPMHRHHFVSVLINLNLYNAASASSVFP